MRYFCLQLLNDDCGFACIKMMLANLLHDKEYLSLPQDLKFGIYNFSNLKIIAEREGLLVDGYSFPSINDVETTPCIAQVKGMNGNHFIFVYKKNKKHVYYYDPAYGKEKISVADFDKRCLGNYLIYMKKIDHKKLPKNKLIQRSFFVYQFFISLVQLCSLFLLSFFSTNFSIYIIVIMIIFFACDMLISQLRIKYMRKYDKEVIYPTLKNVTDTEEKIIQDGINNEYKLKSEFFFHNNYLFTISITIGFIIFFLLINDIKNIIAICSLFIIHASAHVISIYSNNSLIKEISFLERKSTEILNNYIQADQLSYRYANKNRFLNYSILLLIMVYVLVVSIINNNYSSIVYYLIILKFLSDKISELFSYNEKKYKLEKTINYHLSFKMYLKNKFIIE